LNKIGRNDKDIEKLKLEFKAEFDATAKFKAEVKKKDN
jgi:hypothetical protein